MNHLNIDIQNASWLNETQKKKLCKAFDTVRMKDIQQQGLYFLNLDPDKVMDYKNTMIGLLRALSVKEVSERLGCDRVSEMGEHVEQLLNCFSAWDCDDMDTLLEIEHIYNYADNKDEAIDRLMKSLDIA